MIKKILTLLTLLIVVSTPVMAQQETSPGITPDSFLWRLDTAVETARLTFTFNEESKARYNMRIAEERLSEIQAVQNFKNFDNETLQKITKKAEDRRQAAVERARNAANKANTSEDVKGMIKERVRKHVRTLEKVMEKAPEQAREGLQKAVDNSQRVIDNFDAVQKAQENKPVKQKTS